MFFKKRHLLLIFLLSLPLLILALPDSIETGVRAGTARLTKVPLLFFNNLQQRLNTFLTPRGFSRRIKLLQDQIQTLKVAQTQLQDIESQNQRLRSLLSFRQITPIKTIPAEVIGRDPSNWRHTLIIDKGSSAGIRKNMYLWTETGLIGRICQTGRTTSKAILLTDPEFRIAAIIQRSREEAMVCGTATALCKLKYLSIGADIKEGDLVTSSGFNKACPKGLLIGEVVRINSSKATPEMEVFVKPSAYLSQIEEALVITGEGL